MNYALTNPCPDCPFLKKNARHYGARRLGQFARGEFPCHRTAQEDEETGDFLATPDSQHCAGALIYLEKRNQPSQMMRIAKRLGMYDASKLNMEAAVA